MQAAQEGPATHCKDTEAGWLSGEGTHCQHQGLGCAASSAPCLPCWLLAISNPTAILLAEARQTQVHHEGCIETSEPKTGPTMEITWFHTENSPHDTKAETAWSFLGNKGYEAGLGPMWSAAHT